MDLDEMKQKNEDLQKEIDEAILVKKQKELLEKKKALLSDIKEDNKKKEEHPFWKKWDAFWDKGGKILDKISEADITLEDKKKKK